MFATLGAQPLLAVDFRSEIQPILESSCVRCHNAETADGGLRLDSRKHALAGGDSGPAIEPGKPEASPLYTSSILPTDDDGFMPPEERPLAKSLTDLLGKWIADGAEWPEDVTLKPQPRIDFVKHVQPILETHCLSCHFAENTEGELDLSTSAMAFSSGENAPAITPFHPDKSPLYQLTVLGKDADELMPPSDEGGPLDKDAAEKLRLWIKQGTPWPNGLKLKRRAKVRSLAPSPDNQELLRRIHSKILSNSKDVSGDQMKSYSGKVPQTDADYQMVAIRGGLFLMGSPSSEPKRLKIEGPQVKVKVEPFWIGKHEVTWDEYEPFMITQVDRAKHGGRRNYDPKIHSIADAVSQPTPPYTEMSFGMGQRGYPAISMTHHGASKYCQWLSAQTGHFYRLPTEAEWEYACRAGTTTSYSFGNDPAKLKEYGWFYDNSNEKYQKVGLKKPNPWGLHDMHGNVMEWTIDQFSPDYFARIKNVSSNPLLKPETLYPRSVRGGGWDDDPEQLRSAYRRGSGASWKQQDPQLPKSIWYHTNARWLGFRIVRPSKTPTPEEMNFYWNSASGKL